MRWLALLCAALFSVAAAIPSEPIRASNDYRLRQRIPPGCDPGSCVYFMGVDTNEGDAAYLDFYLTAVINGWVAVGVSPSEDMDDADVFGCIVASSNSEVMAIDTYNLDAATFAGRFNSADSGTGSDIITHDKSFEDGRITCIFSRRIIGNEDAPQDRNLDADYYVMFGTGADRGSTQFPKHRPDTPVLATSQFNLVNDSGEISPVASGSGLPNADNVTSPVGERAPADYRLRRRDPSGCDPESCDYFMGVDTNEGNSSYLDFFLTADIGGWVAVGFSRSNNMLNADVVGCTMSRGQVVAIDTHNPQSPRLNRGDSGDGSDIITHDTSFEDGRITCTFSRRIIGNEDAPEDRNLDADYYFMFGTGDSGGSVNFPNHQPLIPPLSDGEFNPATDSGDIGISRLRIQLLQAHGILMLIAWPMLAFTAIFFAVWMKQALPNGEWFQVHRALHIAALFVAVIGFILAFVANMDGDPPGLIALGSDNPTGTAHFVFGIVIMALQISNPLIAIFRCKPDGKYRWIFNIVHGFFIGLGVELLAYTNIGLGVSIFSEQESEFHDLTILWVYLAFVIFALVLNVVLLVVFTGEAFVKGDDGGAKVAPAIVKPVISAIYDNGSSHDVTPQGMEMSSPGEPSKPDGPPPRKPAAADAPLRWIALGVFLGVMVPLILTVIVLIGATADF